MNAIFILWGGPMWSAASPPSSPPPLSPSFFSPPPSPPPKVRTEKEEYGNSLRLTGMFEYFIERAAGEFSDVRYVAKMDDDMNLDLHRLLHDYIPALPAKNVYAGQMIKRKRPNRVRGNKWYVPWQTYPEEEYASYAAGGLLVLSRDVARQVGEGFRAYERANPLHHSTLDDVLLGKYMK
jgi:hypothetical protein